MADQTPDFRTRLEVFDILEQLEAVTASAPKLPLTKRAVVNPQHLQMLVARLRHVLPPEVVQAQEIIRYRDTLIAKAQEEAQRVRASAEQESVQKVSETQLVRDADATATDMRGRAEDEARSMISDVEERARDRMRGADDYAAEVLRKLEGELEALLGTMRRGLEALEPQAQISEQQG